MRDVREITYFGDILSMDGKNTKNIKSRISKGIGIISQIFNLMEVVSFGTHHFKIALLLRDSMLVNGTIYNSEIWHSFSNKEVQEFEDLEKMFFRKLLKVPRTTPIEAFYLECGVLPIGTVIKARRIKFLHDILTREKAGMLQNFS